MTRPGLTTATQPSGEPLPEPVRLVGLAAPGRATRRAGAARRGPAGAATACTGATVAAIALGARRRRGDVGEVGARVALGHDLSLVHPALHADAPERGARLVEAVVDVRAHRVQRHTTVGVAFGARHLRSPKAAGDLHLHAL